MIYNNEKTDHTSEECVCCAQNGHDVKATTSRVVRPGSFGVAETNKSDIEVSLCDACAKEVDSAA